MFPNVQKLRCIPLTRNSLMIPGVGCLLFTTTHDSWSRLILAGVKVNSLTEKAQVRMTSSPWEDTGTLTIIDNF